MPVFSVWVAPAQTSLPESDPGHLHRPGILDGMQNFRTP